MDKYVDNVQNPRESSTNYFVRNILVINNIHSMMNTKHHLTTVTVHVTVLPSTLTVIVVEPALRAVIKPVDDTDAIVPDLVEYAALVLVASSGFIIGSSWYVSPTLSVILVSGSVTDVTGTLTVTVQVAILAPLSLIAVMTAVPADTATTLPLGSTLATEELFDVHEAVLIVAFDGL